MEEQGLHFVALISGGKDSCFTMMEAVRRGHHLVAICNLLPLDNACPDVDSWMFQTAGHGLIEGLACCMPNVPMYRRRLKGSSQSTEMQYETNAADEVEDLFLLLRHVVRRHPQVKAVCSGAILSSYQRLRVETVCQRLSLTSLAYLWCRPQRPLLQDMIDGGIDAVLVKVAAMGLKPMQHLGKSLRHMQPILWQLEQQYGCSVCGEGGEYESFVLDCPLFTRRLELVRTTPRALSSDPVAPVGLLDVHEWRLVDKTTQTIVAQSDVDECIRRIVYVDDDDDDDHVAISTSSSDDDDANVELIVWSHDASPYRIVQVSVLRNECRGKSEDVVFSAVCRRLFRSEASSALFVNVRIGEMHRFVAFNSIYRHYAGSQPAARAVWQSLDHDDDAFLVQASGFFFMGPNGHRKSLHVQSLSCWAPACIGPYSQAISCDQLVWCSGQIPLVADTMKLHEHQTLDLCVQHMRSVHSSIESSSKIIFAHILYVNSECLEENLISWGKNNAILLPLKVGALPRGALYEVVGVAAHNQHLYEKSTIADKKEGFVAHITRPVNADDEENDEGKEEGPHLAFAIVFFETPESVATFSAGKILKTGEKILLERRYWKEGTQFPSTHVSNPTDTFVKGFAGNFYQVSEFYIVVRCGVTLLL